MKTEMTVADYKLRKAQRKAHRSPFTMAHLPVGSSCEIIINEHAPVIATVTAVFKNGPNSYVVETDQPGTVTDFFNANVSWVTQVFKRGPGVARLKRQSDPYQKEFHTRALFNQDKNKHRNYYRSYDVHGLVYNLMIELANDTHLLDVEAMVKLLDQRGCLPLDKSGGPCTWHLVVQKKKIRKAVRQLFNKCLRSHAQAEQDEADQYNDDLERDWARDNPDDVDPNEQQETSMPDDALGDVLHDLRNANNADDEGAGDHSFQLEP